MDNQHIFSIGTHRFAMYADEDFVAHVERYFVIEADTHLIVSGYVPLSVRLFFTLKKNARLSGLLTVRSSDVHVTIELAETGAAVDCGFLVQLSDQQKTFLITQQIHKASQTTSALAVRAVVHEAASFEYSGHIHIAHAAHGASADLQAHALVLGQKARATLTPALEVLTNDVACSHGAAVGYVNEEELWYLMSRGIDARYAESLIVKGFISEFADRYQSMGA